MTCSSCLEHHSLLFSGLCSIHVIFTDRIVCVCYFLCTRAVLDKADMAIVFIWELLSDSVFGNFVDSSVTCSHMVVDLASSSHHRSTSVLCHHCRHCTRVNIISKGSIFCEFILFQCTHTLTCILLISFYTHKHCSRPLKWWKPVIMHQEIVMFWLLIFLPKKISFTICSTSITTTGMCKLGDYIYLPVSYKKTFCKVTSSIVCLVS